MKNQEAKQPAENVERARVGENEMFLFLDDLRESGATNMFGARPYIVAQFGISKQEASQVLSKWMQTFGERHPRGNAQ